MGTLAKTGWGWEMCICWGRTAADNLLPLQEKGLSSGPVWGMQLEEGETGDLGPYCIDKGENESPFFF